MASPRLCCGSGSGWLSVPRRRFRLVDTPVPTSRLYGLDIETDTTVDGLDPTVSPIVAVAVATDEGTTVLLGEEPDILLRLGQTLDALPVGVIVTWNGAGFDLPFIAHRSRVCGVPLSLRVIGHPWAADPPIAVEPGDPGQEPASLSTWGEHRHLDGYRVYRSDVGATLRLSCGLKSMARLVGLTPVEVDRTDISSLPADVLHDYVASDAELARALVLRRWPACSSGVDRVPGLLATARDI